MTAWHHRLTIALRRRILGVIIAACALAVAACAMGDAAVATDATDATDGPAGPLGDAATTDAPVPADAPILRDAPGTADGPMRADAPGSCAVSGAPGWCIDVDDCAALGEHTAFPGHCPGPANIQCCIVTPDVNDNPPIPAGYRLLVQVEVTPAMTDWAVAILHDPVTYRMFTTATMTFGSMLILARVEWHPPDFQNDTVHRGVTLYTPVGP